MAITTEINIAIIDYKVSTGQDAERIYLGRNKIDELSQWANANSYYKTDTSTERPEYAGRKIYTVDNDDCMMVA